MRRRDWLKITSASCLTGMFGDSATAPIFADEQPVEKTILLPAKMRLSLAAYSFNRLLPRNWPSPRDSAATMTLLDFVDQCAVWNLDACELTSYYFPTDITPEYLAEIKLRTFRQGLDISGTAINNDFCYEGEQRQTQLQLTRNWIDYASAIGAPVIRIFAGREKNGQTFEQAVSLCAAGINESVRYAATQGVCLALENHGGITATSEQLLQIVEQVEPSPFFGVNFDSGNFHTSDPYRDLEKIAPLAINAQIKVEIAPNGIKQPADLQRIVEILKAVHYRGYLVLEYEAAADPFTAIPRYLDQLRELIA